MILAAALTAGLTVHAKDEFAWRNLDSDLHGVTADVDQNLENVWGIVPGEEGRTFWVANEASGTVTRYDDNGSPFQLKVGTSFGTQVVTIPPATVPVGQGGTGGTPTGIVFNHAGFGANNAAEFVINGHPSHWLAVTEDGAVVGYNTAADATAFTSSALVGAKTVGAFYTGCTLAFTTAATPVHELFAANFAAGTVDVFDNTFAPVTGGSGFFVDPNPVVGYKPYNVKRYATRDPLTKKILRVILVAYALNDGTNHVTFGAGAGYVNVFQTDGTYVGRLVAQAASNTGFSINAPWGMAIDRKGPKQADDLLLVANHGNGTILTYSLNGVFAATSGTPLSPVPTLGALQRADGEGALQFEQLRGIHFGLKPETAKTFSSDEDELDDGDGTLLFTADLTDNAHGLVGRIFRAP